MGRGPGMTIPAAERALYRAFADDPDALATFDATRPAEERFDCLRSTAESAEADAEAHAEWDAVVGSWKAAQRQREPGRMVVRDWDSGPERSIERTQDDDAADPLTVGLDVLAEETIALVERTRRDLLMQIDDLRQQVSTMRSEIETLRETRTA
jgi:hypothetical protein